MSTPIILKGIIQYDEHSEEVYALFKDERENICGAIDLYPVYKYKISDFAGSLSNLEVTIIIDEK